MNGLTSLNTNEHSIVAPKLNHRRALFVLAKIDEILSWEQRVEHERDIRFVDLGRYLCEVRSGQYWRLDKLGSFDEFLEKRFPESRRKAYYLMAIHEHLPKEVRRELKQVGWAKAAELVKVARSDGQEFDAKRPPEAAGGIVDQGDQLQLGSALLQPAKRRTIHHHHHQFAAGGPPLPPHVHRAWSRWRCGVSTVRSPSSTAAGFPG